MRCIAPLLALTSIASSVAAQPRPNAPRPNAPRAVALIERAVTRMGGEPALRAITSLRQDVMTTWQRTAFGDHPYADAPSYERHVDLRDYTTNAWRNTRTFLPGSGSSVDIVRDTVGGRTATGPNNQQQIQPLNIAYVDERRELFAFAPERMLLLARDAGGLRTLADTTIDGVIHARIATTVDGFPATWFMRSTDGLPAMVRFVADETNDFGLAPWGEQEVEIWYSAWGRVAPGILYPRQRDVRRVGRPYKRMTSLAITINAPAPADSFAIADSVVQRFLLSERRPMWAVPLDSTKIESDAFASFSPWIGAAGALKVGGKWVLIETGQAAGAARNAAEWLARRTGAPVAAGIAARTSTGNGGARWFVDERLPLYTARGATRMLRQIVGTARWSRATPVTTSRWVRIGSDSLWLEPIDLPDTPGALAVYSPAHRWLYSPVYGALPYQVEHDALIARLRARGLAVEWAGGARGFRTPVPPPR